MDFSPIVDRLVGNQAVSSLVLLVAALAVRVAVDRYLRSRPEIDVDQRRRIVSNVKNALGVLIVVGLFFIWAPALRTFALSLTAFAVAIIIATKELILCFSGTVVKMTTGSLRVGDWIEVGEIRGEVIDQDVMSTTLQELGTGATQFEFSGKTIVLPNSIFLTTPVKNERFYKRYVVHQFALTLDPHVDPEPVVEAVIGAVLGEMKNSEEVTRRYRNLIESRAGITLPDLKPKPRMAMTNEGRLRISFSCFLPTRAASAIESKAVAAGLAVVRQARGNSVSEPANA